MSAPAEGGWLLPTYTVVHWSPSATCLTPTSERVRFLWLTERSRHKTLEPASNLHFLPQSKIWVLVLQAPASVRLYPHSWSLSVSRCTWSDWHVRTDRHVFIVWALVIPLNAFVRKVNYWYICRTWPFDAEEERERQLLFLCLWGVGVGGGEVIAFNGGKQMNLGYEVFQVVTVRSSGKSRLTLTLRGRRMVTFVW
jgi:hypothetical protein